MGPLVIRAHLSGALVLHHPIALDSLLMSAYATRENLPPLDVREGGAVEIPIPLERSKCGRIYLSSEGQSVSEEHERRFLNRRFPIAEAQAMGDAKFRRVNPSAGSTKGYRIPVSMAHVESDVMVWYAMGDADPIRELLTVIGYLGKKRSVGLGRVVRWEVEAVEPWDGFPVLNDGRPLRSLPLDWPGLREHRIERRVLSPPYYERWREQECAVS